jgi:hypothetical protein
MLTPNKVSPKHCSRALVSSLLAVVLMLSAIVACRSSSSDSKAPCIGSVVYEGQTFTGQAGEPENAQKFACNNYCLDADPEFDAHYRIWLDSRSGEAAGRPTKKESIYKDQELMDYLTKTCAMKCVASVKEGKLMGEVKCQ